MTELEEALIYYDGNAEMPHCDLVYAALKKQQARKPVDIFTPVITWGLCPVCKGELNKLGEKSNRVFKFNAFCPDCGQALDWGDTDDL